jgi:hypothetical protein
MTIPHSNLYLFLMFRDGLKQVDVFAWAANRFDDPPLRFLGTVDREKLLEELLEAVRIDRIFVTSGEACTPDFAGTAYPRSPRRIVKDLKEKFGKDEEISLKRIGDEKLTDYEESFIPPQGLDVCASTMQFEQGAELAAAWFRNA